LTTWTALDTEGKPMINYNDGKWHKMNGVQPESVHDLSDVEMKWILLDKGAIKESTRKANQFGWEDSANVAGIAFRVTKQYKEPREFYAYPAHWFSGKPTDPEVKWMECDKDQSEATLFREVTE